MWFVDIVDLQHQQARHRSFGNIFFIMIPPKTKILSLEKSRDRNKNKPAVPPKLTHKRPLCLVPSYKPALVTGAGYPLTATRLIGFRSPSEVHSLTTRIPPFSKRRLSARRIESYLLFISGFSSCFT